MRSATLASLLVAVALRLPAQFHGEEPIRDAYVTALTPAGAFEVAGTPVTLTAGARFFVEIGRVTHPVDRLQPLFLGQSIAVFGRYDRQNRSVTATRIVQSLPGASDVHGSAVIDRVLAPGETVRADGYLLHFTSRSRLNFGTLPATTAELKTNLWIDYRGVQGPDGTVDVTSARLSNYALNGSTDRPVAISDTVPPSERGSRPGVIFDTNGDEYPAYPDPAAQARVERIGESLIPPYQKALSSTDPTRIDLRFRLYDSRAAHDVTLLPSGLILVPFALVARLENDPQLAAVLADSIAFALELKDIYLERLSLRPGYTPAGAVAVTHYTRPLPPYPEHLQSGRVALCLMRDAGYDIREAPRAWWLLAPDKPAPTSETPPPARSNDLYLTLGTTWRTTLAALP